MLYRTARRIAVAVVGGTLLCFGALMLVLPGPGLLAIAAGLGVLALEFAWARRWLQRVREQARSVVGGSGERAPDAEPRER